MGESDKTDDRRFVTCLERYFTKTQAGRYRAELVIPSPLFVASDMTYPIQAADLCIYCINWGFRLRGIGMNAPAHSEIEQEFGPWLNRLQFTGLGSRDGNMYKSFGIVFVPDPYSGRP